VAVRSEDLYRGEARVIEFPRPVRTPRRTTPTAAQFRRRRLAASALAVLTATTLFLLATGPEGNALASRTNAPKAITLQPGQGLWDVAERYAAPGQDLRAYVDALIEINDLGPIPQIGERLRLPR
jgi:hypothetical protein